MLVEWSTEAVKSSAFKGFCLSDLEYGVKTYHDHLRKLIPVMNFNTEPIEHSLNEFNNKLLAENKT